jgi:multidrug efflux system membrane fusion protein
VERSFTDREEFSGRLEASEFVELRPRVSGTIEQVHFVDGALVSRGDRLFTIDPRPFAAEVSRLESVLALAKNRAELAKSELARAQRLMEANAIARQELDQLSAASRTSLNDVQSAEAMLRAAKLNLEFTTVLAPIKGRVSRTQVTAGNLVNDQVVLTTIAGVSRVYAYFDGSERTFLRVRAAGDKAPMVRMGLVNEEGYPHVGKLDFVDNRLNPQTGAVRMRAAFDNRAGQFVPGLMARVVMATSTPYTALMVPERAIGTDQTRKFVVVVGADAQPQFRPVQLGALDGDMRVIAAGSVKPGENVVVDGLQRIIPGVPVAPQVLKVDERGVPIPAAPSGPPAAKG